LKTSTQNPRWPPGGHLGFCIPDCSARTDWQIDLKFFCGLGFTVGESSFWKPAPPKIQDGHQVRPSVFFFFFSFAVHPSVTGESLLKSKIQLTTTNL
jgi:hypothetical protein